MDAVPGALVAVFRDVEHRLDALLATAAPILKYAGLQVTDKSVRAYIYNNCPLTWEAEVLSEWREDVEHARITIWARYSEPLNLADPRVVAFTRRSELFQTGQVSRVDLRSEAAISLVDIERRGLDVIIDELLKEAKHVLRQAL